MVKLRNYGIASPSVEYSVAIYSSRSSTYTLTTNFLFVTLCVIGVWGGVVVKALRY
jgi:hypothetical protein